MFSYRLLADLVAILHAGYVLFVVAGLLVIVAGLVFRWSWVRNFWFRAAHLLTILIVGAEAAFGITCPLTDLENYWRERGGEQAYAGDFLSRWAENILWWEAPSWVYTFAHIGFALLVVAVFWLSPPRWPTKRGGHGPR